MKRYKPLFENNKDLLNMSIQELFNERDKLFKSQEKADFIDPKVMRRVKEIDDLIFDFSKTKKGKKSQRVISFTRDRR